MSEYKDRPGSGTVWINDKFTTGGNQPYAKGKFVDLSGKEFELTLWEPKSDKIKGRALNVSVQEPWEKRNSSDAPASSSSTKKPAKAAKADDDDDLPF